MGYILYLEQLVKAKFLFNIYLVLVLKAIPFQHESPTFLYLIYLQGDFWKKHAFFFLFVVSFCFKVCISGSNRMIPSHSKQQAREEKVLCTGLS